MGRRAARYVTTMLLLALAPPAPARVIEVGPQREARTLDAAVARARIGDEIVLQRGVEHLTTGVTIKVDAIEIRSAPGTGEPATIRNTSASKSATTLEHRGEGLVLNDLRLTSGGGKTVTGVRAKGQRLTIDNVHADGSIWRFVHLDGARQTVIRNCSAPKLNDYIVCAFGGETRGLLIERCTFGGSEEEHCIRLQRIHDALLRDSTFSAGGWKSALTLREGADVRVENCTLNGPVSIGPLADGDGGINLPISTPQERARRDELLRRSAKRYTFKNCTIDTSGITLEMGVQDITFVACIVKTGRPWVMRLNRDEYEPWRSVPSGRVVYCEFLGPDGLRVLEHGRPDFQVTGTVINGVRVPDDVPAPPATAPATPSTKQAEARREDVIAALDRVDAVITELHVARTRLHSSTQPAGLRAP